MIAPCGLDCGVCDIRLAPQKPELAEHLTQWLKERGYPDAEPGWFHCAGCPGDRVDHWSVDCWILKCCVDEHAMRHCSDCAEFVCERLESWAARSPKYGAALERLKSVRADGRCHTQVDNKTGRL
jgi:hypothetical protein